MGLGSVIVENFGPELPIGSVSLYQVVRLQANLNAGTGDPCAGQPRLKGLLSSRSTADSLVSTENLGADPPIGSTKSTDDVNLRSHLKAGEGEP